MQTPDATSLPPPAIHDPTPPRHDLYGPGHKALRLWMGHALARLGRMDPADALDTAATLAQAEALLIACRSQLARENRHVHAALEAREPGASRAAADVHRALQDTIVLLRAELDALRRQTSSDGADRLYRHLARFFAQCLEQMHIEEARLNPLLWAAYTDGELQRIEHAIQTSLSPEDVMNALRWMLPAMRPSERHRLLDSLRDRLSPQAMTVVLSTACHTLCDAGWARLVEALGLELPRVAAAGATCEVSA